MKGLTPLTTKEAPVTPEVRPPLLKDLPISKQREIYQAGVASGDVVESEAGFLKAFQNEHFDPDTLLPVGLGMGWMPEVPSPVTLEVTRLAMPTGVTGLSWGAYQRANSPQLLKAVRQAGLSDETATKDWYKLTEAERDALERLPSDWAGKPTPEVAIPKAETVS